MKKHTNNPNKYCDVDRLSSILVAVLAELKIDPAGDLSDFANMNLFQAIYEIYFDHDLSTLLDQIIIPYFESDFVVFQNCLQVKYNWVLEQSSPSHYSYYFKNDLKDPFIFVNREESTSIFLVSISYFTSGRFLDRRFYHQFYKVETSNRYQLLVVNDNLYSQSIEKLSGFLDKPEKSPEVVTSKNKDIYVLMLNLFLEKAIELDASDIHINPLIKDNGLKWVNVLFRIDGDLLPFNSEDQYDFKFHEPFVRLVQTQCNLDKLKEQQDGSFGAFGVNWRVSLIPSGWEGDMTIVFRKLDPKSVLVPLDSVFLNDQLFRDFKDLQKTFSSGFVLVTGITGSGKTTTIHSILRDTFLTFDGRVKIATIEDPIEYLLPWLVQHQVSPSLPSLKILNGLLRADPDWILTGEIRDETLMIPALHSALSGHMTLATFHTKDVPETFTRMTELGVKPSDIVRSTRMIINQKLVKKLCDHCKLKTDKGFFTQGSGCEKCGFKGTKGRVAVAEYLYLKPDDTQLIDAISRQDYSSLSNMIEERFLTHRSYYRWGVEKGFLDVDDSQLKF